MGRVHRVLLVCHANVCRSPLAHGVLVHLASARGMGHRVVVDSAGTWADEGSLPHPRSVAVAAARGISLAPAGCSRGLRPEDLQAFEEILVMDRANLADVERLRRLSAFGPVEGPQARVRLLRHVDAPQAVGAAAEIPDPIGRPASVYTDVFSLIEASCHAWLDEISRDEGDRGRVGVAPGASLDPE